MKAVEFLTDHRVGALYNKGETAGFEDSVADDLIEREIAKPVKGKAKADPAAEKAAAEKAAAEKAAAEKEAAEKEAAEKAAAEKAAAQK